MTRSNTHFKRTFGHLHRRNGHRPEMPIKWGIAADEQKRTTPFGMVLSAHTTTRAMASPRQLNGLRSGGHPQAQAVGNLCSLKRSRNCSLEILPVAV